MATLAYTPILLVALAILASFAVHAYGKRHAHEGHYGFVS